MKPMNINRLLLVVFLCVCSMLTYAQRLGNPSTCVVVGSQSSYYASGWTQTENMTWCVSGGTISGATGSCRSGTPLPSITVTWTTVGTGSVSVQGSNGNGSVTITVVAAFQSGNITSSLTQQIVSNAIPATISCAASTGGICTAAYAYQWQRSADNATWTDIPGATGQHLTFSAGLTQTTYYRRKSSITGQELYSNVATVYVTAPLTGGTISPASQNVVVNAQPAAITGVLPAGGSCSGAYVYGWQSSADGTTFTDIGGATGISYTPPASTATRHYRRRVTCGAAVAYSNVAVVNVFPVFAAGTITAASTSIRYNTSPGLLQGPAATGGTCGGAYTYQWAQSKDNTSYTNIPGATGLTYTPGNLTANTWFIRYDKCGSTVLASNVLAINVAAPLYAGYITASSLNIVAGTSPGRIRGNPASGSLCTMLTYSYRWQTSTDGINFTSVTGIPGGTVDYTPAALTTTTIFRRMATCGSETSYSNLVTIIVHATTAEALNMNYIRTRELMKPLVMEKAGAYGINNPDEVKQETEYFDGLGRLIQRVSKKQGGSATPEDIIQPIGYDAFGRETMKYIKYAAASTDGNYRANALTELETFDTAQYPGESAFYTQVQYDASSLNRIAKTLPPGASWAGSNRGVEVQQMTNLATDDVKIWNISSTGTYATPGAYPAGTLIKTITINENGKQVIEYKNKSDKRILRKVQLADAPSASHTGWLCTYYVYDDYDNVALVIPPKAVELIQANSWNLYYHAGILSGLCFEYAYDQQNRLISKKVPGAKAVYYLYDQWGRQVLMQDAESRKTNRWIFTKYDGQDRPVMTGFYTDNTNLTLAAMKGYLETNRALFARAEHRTNAAGIGYSTNLTFPVLTNPTVLTVTYYDDYVWCSTQGVSATKNNSYDARLPAVSNTVYPYPQSVTQNTQVRGLTTGIKNLILDGGTASTVKVSFYNSKAQEIQTQLKQQTGGTDITTTQYSFGGKIVATHLKQEKTGTNAQVHEVLTKNTLSRSGITRISKKISSTLAPDKPEQSIVVYEHNSLGELARKKLGINDGTLETTDMTYNIRGWISGINADYAKGTIATRYFGLIQGFDKTSTGITGASFQVPQYTGSPDGVVWKSKGDAIPRKYDYLYDNADRLAEADFTQNENNTGWSAAKVDFSVLGAPEHNNRIGYDANGNILSLFHNGLKLGSSAGIDKMRYAYMDGNVSNRLATVTEDAAIGAVNNKLGDFTDANRTGDDYVYDDNGNTTTDKNKGISSIVLNHLNLPRTVTTSKGTIEYIYDAAGTKLSKKVNETGKPSKTTLYLSGGAVYEDDVLQFVSHEEGRIRFTKGTTATNGKYSFDYFLKDHMNNIRMVLTEETQLDAYPLLSFEGAAGSAEVQLQDLNYENKAGNSIAVTSSRAAWPAVYKTNNPAPAGTVNDYGMQVKKSTGAIGAAKLLKVMSGDRLHVKVDYWYDVPNANNTGANGLQSIVASLLGALTTSAAPSELIKGGVSAVTTDLNNNADLGALLNTSPATSGANQAPRAYLNVVFFDEQMKFDKVNSKVFPVQYLTSKVKQAIDKSMSNALAVNRNGYVYVYFSNETEEAVYFDNFQVSHERGRIIEETHYYPYGLTMAGISARAVNFGKENKMGYNGNELQRREFSDGSGLDVYDFNARTYNAQIGRFMQIDPQSEEQEQEDWSTYHFGYNNPARYGDPDGKVPIPLIIIGLKFLIGAAVEYGFQVYDNYQDGAKGWAAWNPGWAGAGKMVLNGATSTINPTGSAARVLTINLASNAAESIGGQLLDGEEISVNKTLTDMAMMKLASKVEVAAKTSVVINRLEQQAQRLERVARNNPKLSRFVAAAAARQKAEAAKTWNTWVPVVSVATSETAESMLVNKKDDVLDMDKHTPVNFGSPPVDQKPAKDNTNIKPPKIPGQP